jgi:hypothetical protein
VVEPGPLIMLVQLSVRFAAGKLQGEHVTTPPPPEQLHAPTSKSEKVVAIYVQLCVTAL